MHVQVDPPPHVLEDELGLRLAAPDDGWRDRPDMDPQATRPRPATYPPTLWPSATSPAGPMASGRRPTESRSWSRAPRVGRSPTAARQAWPVRRRVARKPRQGLRGAYSIERNGQSRSSQARTVRYSTGSSAALSARTQELTAAGHSPALAAGGLSPRGG